MNTAYSMKGLTHMEIAKKRGESVVEAPPPATRQNLPSMFFFFIIIFKCLEPITISAEAREDVYPCPFTRSAARACERTEGFPDPMRTRKKGVLNPSLTALPDARV